MALQTLAESTLIDLAVVLRHLGTTPGGIPPAVRDACRRLGRLSLAESRDVPERAAWCEKCGRLRGWEAILIDTETRECVAWGLRRCPNGCGADGP
ncbi:hypothetical protein [Paludisphaera mucosa]|uniref:Uncharacterized protein n=1 Tax=Paludisphaera mucosa TaxID=3030827 RepID=A0ABT6F793_9BACT|nr:hypothetical protein [Paludisphaera mucosa]MDG3003289.1 hypothetical protein [Paludisphaera mucosa]